jgi:hypothetical protein
MMRRRGTQAFIFARGIKESISHLQNLVSFQTKHSNVPLFLPKNESGDGTTASV